MPDVGTGVMAGVGLISGKKGEKASKRQHSIDLAMLELERERDEFNKDRINEMNEYAREDRADIIERRDRERGLLDPVQESIISEAMGGPDYEKVEQMSDADVAQAYGLQRQQNRRNRHRYGINPASGAAIAEDRRLSNQEALARVTGRAVGRRAEDDKVWAKKVAALGTGNMRDANPTTSLAQLNQPGQVGVMSGMSDRAGQQASGAFQLAGSLFADAADRSKGWNPFSSSGSSSGSGTSSWGDVTDINEMGSF